MSLLYEIWLCDLLKYEPEQIYKYINFFGSAKATYEAKASKYKKHEAYGVLSKVLKADHDLDKAKLLLEECRRKEIEIMSIYDSDYPIYLKNSYLPPRLLFIAGERINLSNYVTLTVVGSRHATDNGKKMAYNLARDLTEQGFMIISGMAEGIDVYAHKGALDAGGKTIAVLAGGADIPYPAVHRGIYDQILKNGAVISEQPPGTAGKPYLYQKRNRIMSGLSYGCIMVEGQEKSGTSITMKHATSDNRDIFAVPGNPVLSQSYIPNSLIKDGATLVTDYTDILKMYENEYPYLLENGKALLPEKEEISAAEFDFPLDDTDMKIINYLKNCGEPQLPDDICEACSLTANVVASKLTMLLMGDIISRETGNKYMLIRR